MIIAIIHLRILAYAILDASLKSGIYDRIGDGREDRIERTKRFWQKTNRFSPLFIDFQEFPLHKNSNAVRERERERANLIGLEIYSNQII